MATKYIAATLAYVSAMVGIADSAFTSGGVAMSQISVLQWCTIAIATLSFLVILSETRRTHRRLNDEQSQRKKVQRVAARQINDAVHAILRPFKLILKYPIEDMSLVDNDACYVINALRDDSFRDSCERHGVHDDAGVYPKHSMWELIVARTKHAREQLTEIASKFGTFLDADTLEAIENVRENEMIGMRLPDLETLVKSNSHVDPYTMKHILTGPGGFDRFDQMLDDLDRLMSVRNRIEDVG